MRIFNNGRRQAGVLCALILPAVLAASGPVTHAGKYECLVEPYLEVSLSSGVAGILAEVLVDRGDRVKAGDVIATLKSDVLRARHDLVRARVEFAERRVTRNQELYLKQMISPHEKDELETEAQLLKLELNQVEKELEQRTIRSPIDGVVVERFFSPGEYVADDEIVKLAQIHPLRVEVAVPVQMFGKLSVGMTGRVEWEAPPTRPQTARVTVVDRVIDAASGTLGLRLELPNPDYALPAGTRCWVTLPAN